MKQNKVFTLTKLIKYYCKSPLAIKYPDISKMLELRESLTLIPTAEMESSMKWYSIKVNFAQYPF